MTAPVNRSAEGAPVDHGFGIQRVPLETQYFEAYNRDNVSLVDLNETPIECITPAGIRTTAGEMPFDIIVYATGFDAFTGAFDNIDITGAGPPPTSPGPSSRPSTGPPTCWSTSGPPATTGSTPTRRPSRPGWRRWPGATAWCCRAGRRAGSSR